MPSTERAEPSMTDKEREAFEAWFEPDENNRKSIRAYRTESGYRHDAYYLNGCWTGWQARPVETGWRPIESAPSARPPRTMFVVRGFGTRDGTYDTDAYAVWRDADGGYARWPHPFPPTHWIPLPAAPGSEPIKQEMPEALSEEQKAQFVAEICALGTDFVAPLFAIVEAIERAVIAQKGKGENNRG